VRFCGPPPGLMLLPAEAVEGQGEAAAGGSPFSSSSKCYKTRQRPRRSKGSNRVHWDEQVIAEHDKERGTRQKIDEPDTPFVRSPQTASDSEGDGHDSFRLHSSSGRAASSSSSALPHPPAPPESSPCSGAHHTHRMPLQPPPGGASSSSQNLDKQSVPAVASGGGGGDAQASSPRDVDPMAVASRLDLWMRAGGNLQRHGATSSANSSDGLEYAADTSRLSSVCSSRSSSSAPNSHRLRWGTKDDETSSDIGKRVSDRRISLPEDSQPKPTSDFFKAKRAQHYNEIASVKAFKKWQPGDESNTESDTDSSDEEGRRSGAQTQTNTNTNINLTMWRADSVSSASCSRRPSKVDGMVVAAAVGATSPTQQPSEPVGAKLSPTGGGAAAFDCSSLGALGGRSSYDHVGEACASSSAAGAVSPTTCNAPPPIQRGRSNSKVSFSGGDSGAESSEDFRDARRQHYASEWRHDSDVCVEVSSLETNTNTNLNAGRGKAPRASNKNPMEARRPSVRLAENSDAREPVAERVSEEFRSRRTQHYDEVAAVRSFRTQDDVEQEDSDEDAAGGRLPRPRRSNSDANPMEPRASGGVAFQDAATIATQEQGQLSPSRVEARVHRQAHYRGMADALRSAPPPSDDEESSDDG